MGRPCQPTCPFFRCSNRSLVFKGPRPHRSDKRGREARWAKPTPPGSYATPPIPLCSMDYEPCQGPKCKYAFCEKRALLPDGTCGLEERMAPKTSFSIEEEAAKMERSMQTLKGKLRRKGIFEEL